MKQLTIDYAKQETLDPVKGLVRFLIFGIVSSVLLGIGLVMWVVALLRLLQNETGQHFTNNLSWVPYALTLAASVVVVLASIFAIGKEKRRSEKRKAKHAEAVQREAADAARKATLEANAAHNRAQAGANS